MNTEFLLTVTTWSSATFSQRPFGRCSLRVNESSISRPWSMPACLIWAPLTRGPTTMIGFLLRVIVTSWPFGDEPNDWSSGWSPMSFSCTSSGDAAVGRAAQAPDPMLALGFREHSTSAILRNKGIPAYRVVGRPPMVSRGAGKPRDRELMFD